MHWAEDENWAVRHEMHYGSRVVRAYRRRPPNLDAMLRDTAARAPGQAAVTCEVGGTLTFRELDARVTALAGNLAAAGLRQGDRLALLVGNRAEFVLLCFACYRLGAIAVPMNIRHRAPESDFELRQSGAAALVYQPDMKPQLPDLAAIPDLRLVYELDSDAFAALLQGQPALPETVIHEDDPATLLYTSGTTGKPKGAVLTHFSIVSSAVHFAHAWQARPGDVTILAVPASHVTGLVAIIVNMVNIGGHVVMMQAFKARAFLELAERVRMTVSILVPAMYNLCLLQPDFERFDLAPWRVGSFGGAPMPEATIARLAKILPNLELMNAYGSTETTSPATLMPLGDTPGHAASVGQPLPCADILVMDEDGNELPQGESGELWIAGPMVVPRYWNNPEADAKSFLHGYWRSGDIGRIDEGGYVHVHDRVKDMINRAGYKVFSAEVENVLTHHPGVVECAVVARPDPVLGERVQAFVVPRGGDVQAADLQAFCAERLSDYKVPDNITFLPDALPRNPNGKVLKTDLRKLVAEEMAAAGKG
ncbi:MAG: AMP-binding protein [Sneathiellaceae bacterium]